MNIKTKLYKEQLKEWPENGHHIMAHFDDEKVIVYQSYRPEIGNFAFQNQYFGGAFSVRRMTWVKPNFLWMMYRNGWGTKVGQEKTEIIFHRQLSLSKSISFSIGLSNMQDSSSSHRVPSMADAIR